MDEAERTLFLRAPRTAVLSTVDTQGRAHAVPVWFRFEDGAFRVITDRGSAKHRNAVRTGRAALTVDERDGQFRHITAEGGVEVVDIVSADERLALHSHYRGAEAARAIVAKGGHERMVLIILHPERWYPSG